MMMMSMIILGDGESKNDDYDGKKENYYVLTFLFGL